MARVTRTELIKYLVPIVLALLVLIKCNSSKDSPGLEYMPEMSHSRAYETYTENPIFENGMTSQLPPKGTVARGEKGFHIEESVEGYELATTSLVNPIAVSDDILARGKEVYTINCSPCHGSTGDGQGSVVTGSNLRYAPPAISFEAPPADLTDGRMFYSITYGRNLMGSYASQVSYDDRWKVIHYIKSLNKNNSTDAAEDSATSM